MKACSACQVCRLIEMWLAKFRGVLRMRLWFGAWIGSCGLVSASERGWVSLPDGPVERIAFGSCAKHWQPQPIWEAIIEKGPDLFLFLGDNIYADTDGTNAWMVNKGQLTGEWNRIDDKP